MTDVRTSLDGALAAWIDTLAGAFEAAGLAPELAIINDTRDINDQLTVGYSRSPGGAGQRGPTGGAH